MRRCVRTRARGKLCDPLAQIAKAVTPNRCTRLPIVSPNFSIDSIAPVPTLLAIRFYESTMCRVNLPLASFSSKRTLRNSKVLISSSAPIRNQPREFPCSPVHVNLLERDGAIDISIRVEGNLVAARLTGEINRRINTHAIRFPERLKRRGDYFDRNKCPRLKSCQPRINIR